MGSWIRIAKRQRTARMVKNLLVNICRKNYGSELKDYRVLLRSNRRVLCKSIPMKGKENYLQD